MDAFDDLGSTYFDAENLVMERGTRVRVRRGRD